MSRQAGRDFARDTVDYPALREKGLDVMRRAAPRGLTRDEFTKQLMSESGASERAVHRAIHWLAQDRRIYRAHQQAPFKIVEKEKPRG